MRRDLDQDDIVSRLRKHGFRVLGTGMYSTVLAKGDSKRVIKVGTDDTWEPYIQWGMKNGYYGSFVPRVYSFHRYRAGLFMASMERLDTTLAKVVSPYQHIPQWAIDIQNLLYDATLNARNRADQVFPGLKCFVARAVNDGFSNDWHNGNWMLAGERPDGTFSRLVLIDPQSGARSDGMKRWRHGALAPIPA